MEPRLSFDKKSLSMAEIIVAALDILSVCLTTAYGIMPWKLSISLTRYGPSDDRTKTWWQKEARLVCSVRRLRRANGWESTY
jgi:hypothetical protein